ncbi:uncharacterized protein Bfra_000362 [Botrytis fragariae]|uniref:Uncharacterized protein n=1 Tax=Botrytis fragariae TaxID=1964551 RepID=A0A8H6B383_9HELO|nr:uncharacterized protein Bfra_000362 [Botrytis fragariae]KAF5878197.1 hypothetical protein Bfra_000362 [Botrytis fragariae]
MSEVIFPVTLKTRFPFFRTLLSVLFGQQDEHSSVVESKEVAEEIDVSNPETNFPSLLGENS